MKLGLHKQAVSGAETTPTIRQMAVDDLPHARSLLVQLGYSLGAGEVERRFRTVAEAQGHSLFVAEQNGQVIGLLHLYARPALDKPPEVIVQALVVDEATRGTGVGRKLMEIAEQWADAQGFTSVALSSSILRTEAHAFYQRLGYRIEATSHLMRKEIG